MKSAGQKNPLVPVNEFYSIYERNSISKSEDDSS